MTCKWNNLRGRGRFWFFPFDKGIGSGSDSIEFRGLDRIRRSKVSTRALFAVRAVGSSRSPRGRLPNTGLRLGDQRPNGEEGCSKCQVPLLAQEMKAFEQHHRLNESK